MMEELTITESKILLALKSLNINKSSGPYEKGARLLVELSKPISHPLRKIFETSIKTASIPNDWKEGIISAIYKKGNKSLASNYHPVSITSSLCKCMERIIINHMFEYMKENCLFSQKQYGFITGRSTVLQLINVLDNWTLGLDNGNYTDVIYMDFQKAFDTVPHKRLINKLDSYNISNELINWIETFLTDRKQKVAVNGKESKWHNVTSGISQGSVIGPLLFVLYINDLPELTKSDTFLFADGIKVFRSITDKNDQGTLQDDLNTLEQWSNKWLLKCHPNKCKHMTTGNNNIGEIKFSKTLNNSIYPLDTIEKTKRLRGYYRHKAIL